MTADELLAKIGTPNEHEVVAFLGVECMGWKIRGTGISGNPIFEERFAWNPLARNSDGTPTCETIADAMELGKMVADDTGWQLATVYWPSAGTWSAAFSIGGRIMAESESFNHFGAAIVLAAVRATCGREEHAT